MAQKLHYRTFGEGPPLYILHGLFGSGRNWTGIARQLSGAFEVSLVDLRNHGDSDHAGSMNYMDMAEDVARLIGKRHQSSVHLLGHSMGGKTAMALALASPALLDRLIIADIAPVQYPSEHGNIIKAMKSLPVNGFSDRQQADALLAGSMPDQVLRQFLLQNLVSRNNGYAWRINLDAIEKNLPGLCDFPAQLHGRSFAGPSRFLAGGNSDYIQAKHRPIISAFFPAAEIRVIDGAGHWLHADRPDDTLQQIGDFLS